MIVHQGSHNIEPVQGNLGKNHTFVWYGVGHDYVKGGHAVGRHHQIGVSQIVHVSDFSPLKQFQCREIGFLDDTGHYFFFLLQGVRRYPFPPSKDRKKWTIDRMKGH